MVVTVASAFSVTVPLTVLVPLALISAPPDDTPLPDRVRFSATVMLPDRASAAPSATVVPPVVLPSALAWLTVTVPLLIVKAPLKPLLLPDRVRSPAPALVRLPDPLIAPDRVRVVPVLTLTVPLLLPMTMALSTVAVVLSRRTPPFKVTVPAPRLLSADTSSVPMVTVMPPAKPVLLEVPDSVRVVELVSAFRIRLPDEVPVMAPLKVWLLVWLTVSALPPSASVPLAPLSVPMVSLADDRVSVPPDRVTALLSDSAVPPVLFSARVPPLTVVAPV